MNFRGLGSGCLSSSVSGGCLAKRISMPRWQEGITSRPDSCLARGEPPPTRPLPRGKDSRGKNRPGPRHSGASPCRRGVSPLTKYESGSGQTPESPDSYCLTLECSLSEWVQKSGVAERVNNAVFRLGTPETFLVRWLTRRRDTVSSKLMASQSSSGPLKRNIQKPQ